MPSLEQLLTDARILGTRWGLTLLDRIAPALAGRWATNMFVATRRNARESAMGVPLGATAMDLTGASEIRDAYVWGKEGPIVLLVHGWGADSGTMCSLVRPLRERGYRVVAFDGPAHGANRGRRTTMTKFVAAVRHVLDRFDPRSELRAVVGHSLGGLATVAALQASGRSPERLVLLSTPSSLNQALRSFMRFWRLSHRIERRIHEELSKSHGVPIEHWDVRTLASRDRFPTLIVHDRDDSVVPFDEADVVATALGGSARVELTSGLGHARILADRRTTALVADFVATSAAAATLA